TIKSVAPSKPQAETIVHRFMAIHLNTICLANFKAFSKSEILGFGLTHDANHGRAGKGPIVVNAEIHGVAAAGNSDFFAARLPAAILSLSVKCQGGLTARSNFQHHGARDIAVR